MTIPGAGGQTPARPDQQYPGSAGVVVSPGSAAIVRARLVIVSGTDEGVFVYNGTPALGNPPIFWATSSATDPFGNPIPTTAGVAGAGTFQANGTGGAYARLASAMLSFLSGSTEFAAASITSFGQPGILSLQSGLITGGDTAAAVSVVSQAAGGIAGGSVQMSAGQIILPSGGGPFVSGEFWNQAVISNANNSGNNVNGLFYRLSADNTVHVIWDITPTNVSGSVMFTLPAQYIPTHQQTVDSGWYGNGPVAYTRTFAPRLQVATNGDVSYQGTANITSGMSLCGSWKFSTTVN